jgi:nucleoside-diphosphate-sugar epimerase
MKIVIIGCGYVGTAVAEYWRSHHHLTLTTTSPNKITLLQEIAPRVELCSGNDQETLAKVIEGQDLVLLTVGAKNRSLYDEAYLETAKNLVAVLQANNSVTQLIYTGSYAVYGDRQGAWVDEETSIAPVNENGEILAQTEQVLLSARKDNLKVAILRLAGIYGTGREIVKIFRSWAGTTLAGTGQDWANWVHLDDIVGAIDLACQKQLDGIYNLSNDVPLKRKDLIEGMCAKHDLPPVAWDASKPSLSPYNTRLSNQKLKDLGFRVIHSETIL